MTLKNVMLMADETPISCSRSRKIVKVDLKRLQANLAGVNDIRVFEEADFAQFPGLVKGIYRTTRCQEERHHGLCRSHGLHLAPHGSLEQMRKISMLAMSSTVATSKSITDIEAAQIKQGDACPKCATPVIIDRAIEIGHIFQLGRKYADALGLDSS
jgi:prolyl-tRNA synthetase